MQSQIINEIFSTVDSKIFQLVLQLIVVGAIILFIKDMTSRVYNYYKLRMSDFSRGIKIRIDGNEGFIKHIGFNEVEIEIDEAQTMFIPVDRFMSLSKVITTEFRKQRVTKARK